MAEPHIDYWAYGYEAFGMARGGTSTLHVRRWPEGACPFPATENNEPDEALDGASWTEALRVWTAEPGEDADSMALRVKRQLAAMGLHPATWSLVTSRPG